MFKEFMIVLKSETPEGKRYRQRSVLLGSVGFVSFTGILIYSLTGKAATPKMDTPLKKVEKIRMDTGGALSNTPEMWSASVQEELNALKKQNEEMKKMMTEMTLSHMSGSQKELAVIPTPTAVPQNQSFHPVEPLTPISNPRMQDINPNDHKEKRISEIKQIRRITFNLDHKNTNKKLASHYVPAGSFVKGVLTSGVIASTSVQSSANPQPVHMELVDLGNLPREFKADVKQCFVIGSSYGDLGSERVFMRLEKLSCVDRKSNEILEVDVDGYVTGEDGANGIRGILVDRSGPAMRNAFLGGFLSGMGDFMSQHKGVSPTTISQGGVAMVNPLSTSQMAQAGAGKGVGNAMEKLSDFYIKRAEQMQPVLEVEPGRSVDIIFKSGFDLRPREGIQIHKVKANSDNAGVEK